MKRSDPTGTVRPEDLPAINDELLKRRHVAVPSKDIREFLTDKSGNSSLTGIGLPEPGDASVQVPSPSERAVSRTDYVNSIVEKNKEKR